MHSAPYVISVAASAVFLLIWVWFFLPHITLAEGLAGVALALVLRHILYKGLQQHWTR